MSASQIRLGQRIEDPRTLSEQLGPVDPPPARDAPQPDMYAGLASYTFGNPRPPSRASSLDPTEAISPFTPVLRRTSPDRTPRPSVVDHPPSQNVSSHPSHFQAPGRPASPHHSPQSRRHPATSPGSGYHALSGSDSDRSEDPSPSTDPIIPAFSSARQRGEVMPDNASHHTFGPASRTHRDATRYRDGDAPSSSSVSVSTSRSSSRASMHTSGGQFSSDEEVEIDYYDGSSSPVTFARDLADIDEDEDLLADSRPSVSVFRASHDGRKRSFPVAIPGAVQGSDAHSIRSREGSILTVRRPSRSWDESSHLSSRSGEDPTIILPKSEPHSRADWISVEVQQQAIQQQAIQQQSSGTNTYDGIDVDYILSKPSEGSIRSFNSRLSFVQNPSGRRRSSPYSSTIGSSPAIEDTFMRHLQKHDEAFNALRNSWSFQREKADASSSRRRQQMNYHRSDKSAKNVPLRVQEMWRCTHVGRFKVDKLSVKPQSADPAKGAQQRIHIRHIPDPFFNTVSGPHSVIHKHSRAVAFSIFRSHTLFAGRQTGPTPRTHINMRLGIMLAPKKVQEQYTSTKTTRQLSTYGLLESESRGSRGGGRRGTQSLTLRERDPRDRERRRTQEKEDRSRGKPKVSSKSKGKDKKSRSNPAESAESGTATSSAGSISNNALQQLVSTSEHLQMKIEFSPSVSSSPTIHGRDPASRPGSPSTLLASSTTNSIKLPDDDSSSTSLLRRHRDSVDSDDRWHSRTTHAEAFSALDPNEVENLRTKPYSRGHADNRTTFERLIRRLRPTKSEDHSSSTAQPRTFQPPWMTTAGRDQQEENDRVLNDLNASFRDVGLLHTNPHKQSRSASKRKSDQGILDQIPDDSLYMLLPLWPGETEPTSSFADNSSASASFVTIPENRQYLLVYYVPFGEANEAKPLKDKKPEKKRAKHSYSSDSGAEDAKTIHLSAFRVVARVVTYDELRLTGIRVPSDGLAVNGPEWDAISYSAPLREAQMIDTVVCQCYGRERGFDFLDEGLLKLGLCTQEDSSSDTVSKSEAGEREITSVLTPIGKAVVEMIWLGCLAITSFRST